ncbi:phosphotransferase [Clostridium sp. YIM B02505]|uniref:Phosphotransferase n=1 Tax=Clostridium yunnanense TaxID=2800325 RepID=A0ABS1EV76_9CLOT|nr:phosphotransferase [Clostridium yunnanense]MBK1813198.1 phosphotransferase [Clostridium yunnanense]
MEINKILEHWNMENEPSKQIYSSAWQIGDKYVLKTGNDMDKLRSNLVIIKALSEQNIPVATVVKTKNGLDYIVEDNAYYFISRKIDGEHLTNIYDDDYSEWAHLIGQVIGRLHIAFRACQTRIYCYDNDFYDEIVGWVTQTFKDKNITLIPDHILNEVVSGLKDIYPKLPRQLIHRDIHPGNMLFQDKLLTGYIDFDLSQINARVFDLCYMALSFLIDNTDDKEKTTKWFEMLNSLVDGYGTITPLTLEEKKAVPVMMMAIEMLFVAYFTDNNDAECTEGAAKILLWVWENKEKIQLQ